MEELNRINVDALYPLEVAANLMALKNADDVIRLHEKGLVTVVLRRVSGVNGRPVMLGEEIVRYNRSLSQRPRKNSAIVAPATPITKPRRERAIHRKGLRRVGKHVVESF